MEELEAYNDPNKTQEQQTQQLEPVKTDTKANQSNGMTLDDFVKESQKLAERRAQISAEQLRQGAFKSQAEDLARKLYGQGVGASSGIGQQVVGKEMDRYREALEPIIQQTGLETAQSELDYRWGVDTERRAEERQIAAEERAYGRQLSDEERAEQRQIETEERAYGRQLSTEERQQKREDSNKMLGLVEAGQITGKQAEEILKERGIDPATYMTPQQLMDKESKEQFKQRLTEIVKDPEVAELIDSEEELNFYLENDMTYEERVNEISETAEALEDWKRSLPDLENALKLVTDRKNTEERNWFKDDNQLNLYKEQIAALETAINQIKGGQVPTSLTYVGEARQTGDVGARGQKGGLEAGFEKGLEMLPIIK
jgi:Holliday junction resolvase RusA-like endonuclease